ncbi:MAG TPA: hypothetical protein VJY33_09180, partial [Isosphaeraceae bacterium]|nr:hypothetical protein [Isosphaeraceae bacterium]
MTEPDAALPAKPDHDPVPGPSGPTAAQQEAIDDALEKAQSGAGDRAIRPDIPLKRQWDDELEA